MGSEPKPEHESPKPLAYMLKLIERTTEPLWTVLDRFMGSGTTGVACVRMGRQFIGIEREQQYFDLSAKRITEATKQGDLFIDKPSPPTQLAWDEMWVRPLKASNPEFE